MKQASKILYIIGNIFNALGFIAILVSTILICLAKDNITSETLEQMNMTLEDYKAYLDVLMVVFIFILVIWFVVLIAAVIARKKADKSNGVLPHVVMLVLGLLGQSLFYIIGSILGLIGTNNN